MSLFRLLDRAVRMAPGAPAIARGTTVTHTFAALADRAVRLGGALRFKLSLAAGDRVAILMQNTPAYLEVLFACWRAGLAAVPINAKLHRKEVAFILANCGARVAFATPELMAAIEASRGEAPELAHAFSTGAAEYERLFATEPYAGPAPDASALAWLFYTSGTTGRPKGAMITHHNLLAMTMSYFADIDQIAPGDSILHAAPLSHGSGLYALPHMAALATQVIPESGGFDVAEIVALADYWRGLTMFAAPTMLHRLIRHPGLGTLPGFKTFVYGGAPMHVADVKASLAALGPRLAQLYGQGESPMCITGLSKRWYADASHPRFEAIIGSAGFPQLAVEVAVMGADDSPLPAGEPGEICVRGAPVVPGYWKNDKATAETFRNGWLHTGDIGAFDRDGFLTLLDRSKDMIISGGSNIYPREIEEVLLRHPEVAEVSVVGRPHAEWGEEVVAFIVTRSGDPIDTADLDALCRAEIARFKRPRLYRFLAELPKNNYGKILKRELRELLGPS
jgi:long-chain acyl-CoA synthetase